MSLNLDELKSGLAQIPATEIVQILGKDFLPTLVAGLSESERARLFGRSQLSNTAIKRNLEQGNIVIDPFNPRNLKSATYDARLGQYYFQDHNHAGGRAIFNIYDPDDVKRVWGEPQMAQPLRMWLKDRYPTETSLVNIHPDDLVIPIEPGGTVLGHTIEFIGGKNGIVTSHMKARSSFGRCFMEVCKCAGEGDVGFCSRWTMEFTNNSPDKFILLVVGRRIAQIVFLQVEPINGGNYADDGKYQHDAEINEIKAKWTPEDMLPKLYRDYEVVEGILGSTFLSK